MSDTENGEIAMVPPEKYMPSEAGVAVYRHVFTFIDVVALPDGERVLRLRTEGNEVEFRLDPECAAHLARLLCSAADASGAEAA